MTQEQYIRAVQIDNRIGALERVLRELFDKRKED